ncbi:helix-turn-helix domain-containing protein [Fructilactobacillus cliffordii]|uniref:Helix-turn-helix transcriptional regulator n=1 Tax=Fructilactobacillus cliffordii TaxID=2940299 RepID=A0A9Q8ZPX9_9LACO|nr:helix-turn-helix transcriptional regulator [Fructilactobacillus cliffordii]USS89410.1 helix-turn-helix transcriptional regulator [Fructilactobacillus cliffordii]
MENHFASQLKKLRTKQGFSQEDLAQQLFISRQAVSRWEAGTASPDLNTLIKLTQLLDCSLDELVFAQPASEPQKTKATSMNFWEFIHLDWWLVFAFGGFFIWMLRAIVRLFS